MLFLVLSFQEQFDSAGGESANISTNTESNEPLETNHREPDPDIPAITPAPLEESWAIDWWMDRHLEKQEAPERESARIVFLGNSITQGLESEGEEVWNQYYADRNAFNLGFSGDRTENVLWRLQNGAVDGLNPEVVVLMIGTNNTGHRQDPPDETARGIEMILKELKTRLPDTRILLLAIFPHGEEPDHEMRQLNSAINQQIADFSDQDRVWFMNINKVFLSDNGYLPESIMPDFLHPNEKGYRLWAEAMEPMLNTLLR